jgi:endoglucanase
MSSSKHRQRHHWSYLQVLFALSASSLLPLAHSQLSLPSPAWRPPPASSGSIPTTSPNTSMPNTQWGTLLGDVLWFYEAQRSGSLPPGSANRVAWRNSSALDDVPPGGYYDAGGAYLTSCANHRYLPFHFRGRGRGGCGWSWA